MSNSEWNTVIEWLRTLLVWFLIVLTALCIVVLILFDTFVGAGFLYGMTQGDWIKATLISMATTGLLIALMFLGKRMLDGDGVGWSGLILLIAALGVYGIDTYFDSLGADIMRYGDLVSIADLPTIDQNVQVLYRILIGGMSTVGEPLAIAIITGMSVVEDIISAALPGGSRTTRRTYPSTMQKPPKVAKYDAGAAVDAEQKRLNATIARMNASMGKPAYRQVSPEQEAADLAEWMKSS